VASQVGLPREHYGDPCHLDSQSVIGFGEARIVDGPAQRENLLNQFNRRYRPEAAGISAGEVKRCGLVEITLTELTGRLEREKKRTLWRHVF
jgi:nitroimidazol reductase NimA-like FMN-containing flavoprotein (pyridoxamine 5'-phosphate oxidase superfamily)